MRKIKVIGLAIVAAAALSAVAASAASAASYKSETPTTYVTAFQEGSQTFKMGFTYSCTGTSWSGEFTSPATSLTATKLAITGCKAATVPFEVNMNGCDFDYGEPAETGAPYTVKVITIGPVGCGPIVFSGKSVGCALSIKPQTTFGSSTLTNNAGPPKTITLNTNLSFTYTSSGGICGPVGKPLAGTATGKLLLRGYSDAAHTKATGIFIG